MEQNMHSKKLINRRLSHITKTLALFFFLFLPETVLGQASLLSGFGGNQDFGENVVPRGDDNSSSQIDLSDIFPAGLNFFGTVHTSMWINTNGNLSFHRALSSYTPSAFPVSAQPIIAPWWGDVDTRNSSSVDNQIYYHLDPENNRFISTWNQVGYYSQKINRYNNFQVILTDRTDIVAGDFDVEFRYNRCEWTTGDASGGSDGLGGTPAQAGFDAGDNENYFALPGSLTAEILNLCTTSNVDDQGIWRFQIRSGSVVECGNGFHEQGEECDDGNAAGNDGCAPDCLREYDSDGDGEYDNYDNCPPVPNPDQENADSDQYGDVCES